MKRKVTIGYLISAIILVIGAIMQITHTSNAMIVLLAGYLTGTVISFRYTLFLEKRVKELEDIREKDK